MAQFTAKRLRFSSAMPQNDKISINMREELKRQMPDIDTTAN